MKRKGWLIFIVLVPAIAGKAQEATKIHLTTGAGFIKVQGELSRVFRPSLAFNSGVEINLGKNWYGLAEAGFNSLRYNQQVKEDNSPFLFQNTNSSLFLLGINAGKNFYFGDQRWFTSLYGGAGFLNIGEPRISVDEVTDVARQYTVRKSSIYGRAGARGGYTTRSAFFQTLYVDVSWWTSPVRVQDNRLHSLSVFVGIRMGMGKN
jgi:hypothetical protein